MKPCILLIEDDRDMRDLVSGTSSTAALMFNAPMMGSKAKLWRCNTHRI